MALKKVSCPLKQSALKEFDFIFRWFSEINSSETPVPADTLSTHDLISTYTTIYESNTTKSALRKIKTELNQIKHYIVQAPLRCHCPPGRVRLGICATAPAQDAARPLH